MPSCRGSFRSGRRPAPTRSARSRHTAQLRPPAALRAWLAGRHTPGIFYVNTNDLKAQPIFGMETALCCTGLARATTSRSRLRGKLTGLPRFRRYEGQCRAREGWALYSESQSSAARNRSLHRPDAVVRPPVGRNAARHAARRGHGPARRVAGAASRRSPTCTRTARWPTARSRRRSSATSSARAGRSATRSAASGSGAAAPRPTPRSAIATCAARIPVYTQVLEDGARAADGRAGGEDRALDRETRQAPGGG